LHIFVCFVVIIRPRLWHISRCCKPEIKLHIRQRHCY